MADAKQLLLRIYLYLCGTVLLGLLLNSLFGWDWAAPRRAASPKARVEGFFLNAGVHRSLA